MKNRPDPLCRLYLRASTTEQDASRARAALETFAKAKGLRIAGAYIEHVSGATLDRPELWRLLEDSEPGDLLLTEQVDRISRLTEGDWRKLRSEIDRKGLRIVALDLPTSYMLADQGDEFTARMQGAINSLMLDMLAAIARKDYTDRRRRQAEGVLKAREAGRYRGRMEDKKVHARIDKLLGNGVSWKETMDTVGCSRTTVARVAARRRAAVAEQENASL